MQSSKKLFIIIAIVIGAVISGVGMFNATANNQLITQKQEHHNYSVQVNDTVTLGEKQGKGRP